MTRGWKVENSYTQLPEAFYVKTKPEPGCAPRLVAFNDQLASIIGLDPQALQAGEGIDMLAGNQIPEGATPIAQAYAGHQFGNFTMLGDGRAVLLGEQITPDGNRLDIQLKGSGRTPFSRGGDGRAGLGPMLREYIISEAMHGLGIPTTRSLAVVLTGEPVYRETELMGAVLTRVSSSHIRVGTFQYAAARNVVEDLRALADYTIIRHYPEVLTEDNPYLALLEKVIEQQAILIAKWQLVGFVHGVMNTDNMAISGETIDYGPCAFMDAYDPATVFSSIDRNSRYAFGNQPSIASWNLARFAETLLPLIHDNVEEALALAQEKISGFSDLFQVEWQAGMRAKLGLFKEEQGDEKLINDLLRMMKDAKADYTNTFIALTVNSFSKEGLFITPEFNEWQLRWQNRLQKQPQSEASSKQLMRASNPAVIPRNHRVEEALAAAVEQGDMSVMERLLLVLADPYAHVGEQEAYATPSPSTVPFKTFCGT